MMKISKSLLIATLLFVTILPAIAQDRDDRDHRDHRRDSNFSHGVRNAGHGGNYYDPRYDNRQYNHNQGGIGPGKGALIGAGGGAVLGALFGGGLKGTLIGGAAGAGIGAAVGKVHQNRQRNDRYDRLR